MSLGVRSLFKRHWNCSRHSDGKTFNSPQEALDYAATLPVVVNSMAVMQDDINNGRRELNPMSDYAHNDIINSIFPIKQQLLRGPLSSLIPKRVKPLLLSKTRKHWRNSSEETIHPTSTSYTKSCSIG